MTLSLRLFFEDWIVGFRLLKYMVVLGGLCIVVGAITGLLIFAVLVALLARLLFQTGFPESYGAASAVIGARFGVWP